MPTRVGLKPRASEPYMDRDYTTDYPPRHPLDLLRPSQIQ